MEGKLNQHKRGAQRSVQKPPMQSLTIDPFESVPSEANGPHPPTNTTSTFSHRSLRVQIMQVPTLSAVEFISLRLVLLSEQDVESYLGRLYGVASHELQLQSEGHTAFGWAKQESAVRTWC